MGYIMSMTSYKVRCPRCGRIGKINVIVYDRSGKVSYAVSVKHYDNKKTASCYMGTVNAPDIVSIDNLGAGVACLVYTAKITGAYRVNVLRDGVEIQYPGYDIVLKIADGKFVSVEYDIVPESVRKLISRIVDMIIGCYRQFT